MRVDGFWSFFFDGPSVIVPDAVTGFRALGMENTANAVTKAMRLLADFYPYGRELRQKRLYALLKPEVLQEYLDGFYDAVLTDDPFDEIQTDFYHWQETENGGYSEIGLS